MTYLRTLILLIIVLIVSAPAFAVTEKINRGGFKAMHLDLGVTGYYGPIFMVNENMKRVSHEMADIMGIKAAFKGRQTPNNTIVADRDPYQKKKRYTNIIHYKNGTEVATQSTHSFSQVVSNHRENKTRTQQLHKPLTFNNVASSQRSKQQTRQTF